jgi:predicted transcriptional regulator
MADIDNEMHETLITLTSDIVAAHVGNNSVGVADLPELIGNVYSALAGLGAPAAAPEAPPTPAVPVRSSVKKDKIICLEDGMELKMLKRHLMTHHGLTPAEYRQRWSLPADYPMVAPNYTETRRDLAKKIGLGRKPGTKVAKAAAPAKAPAKRGRPKKAAS